VMEAVEASDPVASSALEEAISYLAVGIANLSRTFRPDMIVLGGYMFEWGSHVPEKLEVAVHRRPRLFGMNPLHVVVGELGGKACSIGAGTLVLENFFGVPQQVMAPVAASQLPEPSFEHTLVWPRQAENGKIIKPSTVPVAWAGNLQPAVSRVRVGDPISITVDVRPAEGGFDSPPDVKVLLHWDRVSLYGANWATPKNSPMQLLDQNDGEFRYGITLGTLPPGRYEFAAHVLGKNDIWVRSQEEHGESNGRVEVIPSRAVADVQGILENYPLSGKEADRPKALVER